MELLNTAISIRKLLLVLSEKRLEGRKHEKSIWFEHEWGSITGDVDVYNLIYCGLIDQGIYGGWGIACLFCLWPLSEKDHHLEQQRCVNIDKRLKC